jgi:hypothetical protein
MLRFAAAMILTLLSFCPNAAAQVWEAVALGPGSEPGTVLVEIRGTVSDPGECGPDPAESACVVYWSNIEGSVTPCAPVLGAAGQTCGPSSVGNHFYHYVLPGQDFAFQVEIQEGVTYTVDAGWGFGAYMDAGMHDCEPASDCGMAYRMTPDPLVLTAAVPVPASGWGTLKAAYSRD